MSFTLGIAIIARNGVKTLPKALTPFDGLVDEIAIVLGGKSRDRTPKLARKLADKVAEYDGALDDKGALLDFAAARNQAVQLLSTDWFIAIDCDDLWLGVEHIRPTIEEAIKENAPCVWVGYHVGNQFMHQPRIFKRDSGQWVGAIHEHFDFFEDYFEDGKEPVFVKSADISLSQQARPGTVNKSRLEQNIAIGEAEIVKDPDNLRAIANLTNDYATMPDHDKVIATAEKYLAARARLNPGYYDDELYYVQYKRAASLMNLARFEEALVAAVKCLGVIERGAAWSVVAESVLRLSNGSGSTALLDLAVMAADKALTNGKPRGGFAESISLSTTVPLQIKALALSQQGKHREALHAVDLGLSIAPKNDRLKTYQQELAAVLNEVP